MTSAGLLGSKVLAKVMPELVPRFAALFLKVRKIESIYLK